MRASITSFSVTLLALAMAGCTTIYSDPELVEEEARLGLEMQNQQVQVERLQSRVQEMELERQELHRRMDALQSEMQALRGDSEARFGRLESGMAGYESARVRDREEVVNQLSRQVSEIVRTPPAPSRSRTAEGYEHVVKPGETLSAIASAYGARSAAIIEANNLKNPDNLRAGQKLFIPE